MRALTFQRPGCVTWEEVPDPAPRGAAEAIVRVRLAGLCGSDLHPYRGDERGLDAGTVMGHEFVGEILETGPGVSRLRPGDRVASPFTTCCGSCFYCRCGLTSRCTAGQLFGWVETGAGLDGAQAQYLRVPLADTTLVRVPDGVGDEEALLAGDVLATGLFGAELGGAAAGALCAVVGCGPVGLAAILGARELGAERIFAFDPVAERRALAAGFGAQPLDPGEPDARDRLRAATAGRGADVVLEAVGNASASRLAIDLVRPGGTVAAVGFHTEGTFAFSPVEAYDKNLTYRAGRCPARAYLERTLALAASRKYDLGAMVSHRLPLSDGPRGYEIFDRKLECCTKVVFEP